MKYEEAVNLAHTRDLSNLEKQGLIQAFEFTHELAWNVMKDYFEFQGESDIHGSRVATRLAFQRGIILNGHIWMEMIESRNKTSHTYNEETVNEIYNKIINFYFDAFKSFKLEMTNIMEKET